MAIVPCVAKRRKIALKDSISFGSGLTRQHEDVVFVREGGSLGQHRVDAQVDGCLITGGYPPIYGKSALMLVCRSNADRTAGAASEA